MARFIISANSKGGVGKTTLVDIIGIYLASQKKHSTLILDFDPSNCSLSKKYIKMEKDPTDLDGWYPIEQSDRGLGFRGRCSTADIFLNNDTEPYKTSITNLDILPAYSSLLYQVDETLPSDFKKNVVDKIENWLINASIYNKYDFIIADTPPVRSKITKGIIKFATDLIIPTTLEPAPIEGLFGMLQIWGQENLSRDKNNPLNLLGILPNMYRRNVNLQKGYLDFLKNNAGASDHIIPYSIDLSNVFSEIDHRRIHENRGSIFTLSEKNKSRIQVEQLCEFLYKKLTSEATDG